MSPHGPVTQTNGEVEQFEHVVERSISTVPITVQRRPFINTDPTSEFQHAGTARANTAPTLETPHGMQKNNYAQKHAHQTVLQQHCAFFDPDSDGIIWPHNTFTGFHALGFGLILSFVAVLVIHGNFAYPTCPSWIPDPFFRVYLKNIHMDKHGSDTNTYDHEGRFLPQHFEDIFQKYGSGEKKDCLTIWDLAKLLRGQRCIADPIGWGGAFFEWLATYLLLWPEDGRMMKEDIRGIYDGSIFYTIAERRSGKKSA